MNATDDDDVNGAWRHHEQQYCSVWSGVPPPADHLGSSRCCWDESLVPDSSHFRHAVLRLLSPTDKLSCAFASGSWYRAASTWDAWAPTFERDKLLGLCVPPREGTAHGVRYASQDSTFIPLTCPEVVEHTALFVGTAALRGWSTYGGLLVPGNSSGVTHRDSPISQDVVCVPRCAFGAPFDLDSPLMFASVISAASRCAPGIEEMFPSLDAPRRTFLGVFAALFGRNTLRYEEQYPIAHALLRHPTFLALPVVDVSQQPVYGTLPPYLILLAHISRWHLCDPQPKDVAWLVSFGRWVADAKDPRASDGGDPLPFHKLLLAPLLVLVSHPTIRLSSLSHYWAVVDAALRIIRCYLYLEDMAQIDSTGDIEEPSHTAILSDTDPRLTFSVLGHLYLRYSTQLAEQLTVRVQRDLGSYGAYQLRAAVKRITFLSEAKRAGQ